MIYHLTTAAEWKEAQEQGIYVAPSLETEGFIHCSTQEQVAGVAKRHFAGKKGLVLLHLDEKALDAELRFEPSTGGEDYPHIYGAINLEAVVKAEPFVVQEAVERVCSICSKPKAVHACGVCGTDVCRGCGEFLQEGSFDFLANPPAELKHTHYCPDCFETHVVAARENYDALMEQAKAAYFFFKTQKRQLPIVRRALEPVTLEGRDRNELILRLAFRAVEQGFNAIIEAEVDCEKIRNEGYQKSLWRGVGLPALVDAEKLEARR